MFCSLVIFSSMPTIASCFADASSSLAARRDGKLSMKLFRSRSLATSSSYFSRRAASSAALNCGPPAPCAAPTRASIFLIWSCVSLICDAIASTSLFSRWILLISASRCSSGLCLLRSSSCCASYFRSVSVRICSCSCSDRCLSGLRASSPSCVVSVLSSSSIVSSYRLHSACRLFCSASRSWYCCRWLGGIALKRSSIAACICPALVSLSFVLDSSCRRSVSTSSTRFRCWSLRLLISACSAVMAYTGVWEPTLSRQVL
mmetsp:Transcript_45377/g.135390  ORF Transcript_45377/g.135390 Transcript_45377/m.135390 type:complete len:260 (-) Transcript_45377:762-1541(-)